MVKTCKLVIAWNIHGSVQFQLVCNLFLLMLHIKSYIYGGMFRDSNRYEFKIHGLELGVEMSVFVQKKPKKCRKLS